jgi:signal transduction histidine kinase
MILTLQFLLVAILPASLILFAVKARRSVLPRRVLIQYWTLALLAMAVWASSVMRFYGGITLPAGLIFTWGFIGRHALSLAILGVLLTTGNYLAVKQDRLKLTFIATVLLMALGFLLDPAIWGLALTNLSWGGGSVRYFDIWAGIWISACLLPLIASWIWAQQIVGDLPLSLFRNHTHYWVLTLLLFLLGSGLAVVQQPNQPLWQEVGVVVNILAAALGTLTLTSSQLPDLTAFLRRLLARVSGSLFLFILAAGAFYLVRQLPARANDLLILGLAAAVFTAVVIVFNRWGIIAVRPTFRPVSGKEQGRANDGRGEALPPLLPAVPGTFAGLFHPRQLGEQLLDIARSSVEAEDAWLFLSEPGVGGRLLVRGVAAVSDSSGHSSSAPKLPAMAEFPVSSPFVAHLRVHGTPLLQNDIFSLPAFDSLSEEERQRLLSWQRVLYVPMHIGTRLVGLLALGKKRAGAAYERQDVVLLQSLVALAAPFLVQAGFTTTLERVNEYLFRQNQAVSREKRALEARLFLDDQLLALLSPELRQPLLAIAETLARSEAELNGRGAEEAEGEQRLWSSSPPAAPAYAPSNGRNDLLVEEVRAATQRLRGMVERLVALAALVRGQQPLRLAAVQLEELIEEAIRTLATMAEARRVRLTFNRTTTLPLIMGDGAQLQTALHHLLHNAIKFNRIGGVVSLDVGLTVSHIYLRVADTGVGIPAEKMHALWQGFAPLSPMEAPASPWAAEWPLLDYRPLGRGLTVAHYIVLAHGGRLEAQSVYGRGSTFTLYLPLDFELKGEG